MDFKKTQEKPNQSKSLETFVKCLWFPKNKLGLWERNPYPRGMDLKIYKKSKA